MIAQGQRTIVDLNDPIQQGTAPAAPVTGMLWLNTSEAPPQLYRYNGTGWDQVNEVDVGGVNLIQAAPVIPLLTPMETPIGSQRTS